MFDSSFLISKKRGCLRSFDGILAPTNCNFLLFHRGKYSRILLSVYIVAIFASEINCVCSIVKN